jgi:hypothetical protein
VADSPFADFDSFELEFLRLPIGGRVYVIRPVGIRTGGLLRRAADGDAAALAELDTGEAYYRAILGPAYDQMLADDVPAASVDRAAITALADFTQGRAAALVAWKTGQDPKVLAAAMAYTEAIATTS